MILKILKPIFEFFESVLDRIISAAGALIFMQIPTFLVQYTQRLGGHVDELANLIKGITGFKGSLNWDVTKPDGTFRKLQDVSKLKSLGWQAHISLKEGIQNVYKAFCQG